MTHRSIHPNAPGANRIIHTNAFQPWLHLAAALHQPAPARPVGALAALAELADLFQAGGLNQRNTKMIQTHDPEVKDQVKRRLARIEGQLRGVQKMIDEERDCKEIIQQMVAIRAGIHAASISFLQAVTNECLLNTEGQPESENQQAKIHDLIQMLGKIAD